MSFPMGLEISECNAFNFFDWKQRIIILWHIQYFEANKWDQFFHHHWNHFHRVQLFANKPYITCGLNPPNIRITIPKFRVFFIFQAIMKKRKRLSWLKADKIKQTEKKIYQNAKQTLSISFSWSANQKNEGG